MKLSGMVVISLSRVVRIDFDWTVAEGIGAHPTPLLQYSPLNRLQRRDQVSQKACGSLSPSSSDSQATGRSQPAIHSLTSVVLPKPAGAEMRVSLQPEESPRSAARSGGGGGQF